MNLSNKLFGDKYFRSGSQTKPNTQQISFQLSINNIRKNNKKEIKYRNKANKGNYFYSYNNIINNFPIKSNINLEKEKTLRNKNGYNLTYTSSNSSKRKNDIINSYQNLSKMKFYL